MKIYPVDNEHRHTADTAKKHKNSTIYGKNASQHPSHIAWQVHVSKPKHTLPFSLQYKLANAR